MGISRSIHQEETEHHPGIISLLQHYEDQYNWNGLKSSLKFEKDNPGTAVNKLFNSKKDIHIDAVINALVFSSTNFSSVAYGSR